MPPSEPPKGTKSRAPRRKVKRQAPSSEALKGRAYGSRPARPLPKPRPAPRPSPPPRAQPQRAPKSYKPTATQLRSGRAQRAAHVSQGKAVQKTARQQQRAARVKAVAALPKRGGGGGDFDVSLAPDANRPAADAAAAVVSKKIGKKITLESDNHYYKHVKRPGPLPDLKVPVDPFTGKADRKYLDRGPEGGTRVQQQAIQAPALKVLEQTQRLSHATAGAEVAALKGKNVTKAAERGAQLKDKKIGSDVLKAAGVKNKGVAAAGGFALDVLQSPLTYVTGGTGSVATKAGERAATRVARKAARVEAKAAKIGHKPVAAQNLAEAARRRAEAAAPAGRGITVKVAVPSLRKGKRVSVRPTARQVEVPGVRRATGATARGVRKVTRTVVGPRRAQRIAGATRRVARQVAPRLKAPGATHEQTFVGRASAREARALRSKVAVTADVVERQLGRYLKPGEGPAFIRAREKGDLKSFIAPTKKARDELAKTNPKEFQRKSRAVALGNQAFEQADELYQRATKAGAAPRQQPHEYLTSEDTKRLDRTVASERAQQRRAVVSAGRKEAQAREPAVVAEAVGQVRHAGRVAVSREKNISQARQALGRAKKALNTELAKPVARRRGVPVLESRVAQARAAYEQARRPVTQHLAEKPAVVGPRVGRAAERYERRAADTQLAQQRLAASRRVPTRSMQETPEAYLRRVHQHAVKHDLPLVKKRAETLLAKKPAERTRAYFPRETQSQLKERVRSQGESLIDKLNAHTSAAIGGGGQAKTVGKHRSGFKRVDQRPLHVVNPEREARGLEKFEEENVPLVIANHLREAAKATSEGEFAQSIARGVGRPVRTAADIKEGEDLYRLGFEGGQFGLHKVPGNKLPSTRKVKVGESVRTPTSEVSAGRRGGQYVAMPRGFFENMQQSTRGTASSLGADPAVMVLDRAQQGWKGLAITNLAFQVRNMLGDIQAGYYTPGAFGSLGNIPSAIQATRRASEMGRYIRAPTKAEQGRFAKAVMRPNESATIHVAGKPMNLDQFVRLAIDNGVPDTGVVAREVRDIGGLEAERTSVRRARTRVGRGAQATKNTLNRWVTNRENVMRLGAFKQGLDRGMTPREAADMASFFHIDYGELSTFERELLRRAMPFYTWTARSLPVAGVTMIQRPGKFVNLESAREEIGAGFTGEDEQSIQERMPAVVKRNVPVVIRAGGSDYALSASLPVTLLNEFPASTDVGKYLDEIGHTFVGMLGPYAGVKPILELSSNRNFFTRQDIHDPQRAGGYVPAPGWVGKAPPQIQKALGATQILDKDTGKKIWAWPDRLEYASKQVPGAAQQVSAAASGARAGQEKLPTAVGIASPTVGVRVDKLGQIAATKEQKGKLREERARLTSRTTLLNAKGITAANATPEYKRLRKRINEINNTLHPRKKKGRSSGGGGGGGFSGFGGGGGGSSSGGGFSGF